MKYLIATLAAGVLILAAANECHAQKGYGGGMWGGGGYGGYGHGQGYGYGAGHGYSAYGHYYARPRHHYHGFDTRMYNVPSIPAPAYQAGPPTAAVTYPYYTIRGPRDFLLDDPPSLGR